jgi:hypothetical protein
MNEESIITRIVAFDDTDNAYSYAVYRKRA